MKYIFINRWFFRKGKINFRRGRIYSMRGFLPPLPPPPFSSPQKTPHDALRYASHMTTLRVLHRIIFRIFGTHNFSLHDRTTYSIVVNIKLLFIIRARISAAPIIGQPIRIGLIKGFADYQNWLMIIPIFTVRMCKHTHSRTFFLS